MLNALYQDAIIATARRAVGRGRLVRPDGTATVDNPLCGDRVTLDVELGASGCVARVGHVVRGCLLCEAAAALIAEHASARDVEDLLRAGVGVEAALRDGAPFPWPELEMFVPVRDVKSRHRCVGLPFEALGEALAQCAGNGFSAQPAANAEPSRQ